MVKFALLWNFLHVVKDCSIEEFPPWLFIQNRGIFFSLTQKETKLLSICLIKPYEVDVIVEDMAEVWRQVVVSGRNFSMSRSA